MNTKIYTNLTNDTNEVIPNTIEHVTIQYVDDSNNIITSNDNVGLEMYINKYFKLLESFYNLNKLKINPDKSKIMITCKPQLRNSINNIQLTTTDYTVQQVTKVKALGIFITSGLSNIAMTNNIISKVNYRLSILKGVFKFCDKKTKTILMNSIVISIFRYCCPLLINSNTNLIAKLQTQLMKCTRYILGYESYKMSTVAIMNNLKFMTVYHMIVKESVSFIHKIIYNNSPSAIYNLLSYSEDDRNMRKVRKVRVNQVPINQKVKDSIIYRSIYLFL